MTPTAPGLAELPMTSALSLRNSEIFCSDECCSYHAVWGFLRMFGDLPAVTQDHDFMCSAISAALAAGKLRVLISGCADHGILAYVIAAAQKVRCVPEITVVDLCQTPLETNKAYAALYDVRIETAVVDVLSVSEGGYDLIIAHNFLNFFRPEERQHLVHRWFDILNAGGQVLSVSTVKTGAPPTSRRFEQRDAQRLLDRMKAARKERNCGDLISEDKLEQIVFDYARRRISHNITTQKDLLDLFRAAGFNPAIDMTCVPHSESVTTHRQKQRVCLVACKGR